MVINKNISLESHGFRIKKYYESIGYDTSNDYIEVLIEHLTPGSRHILEVQCDFCDNISKITNKEYSRNISIGGKYSCCKKCGSEKAKLSNIDKYGVSHPMMSDVTQSKARKTNLERYGVEFLQQSPEMRERSKKTLMERYGVDHISKTDEFKISFKKTCMDNHGVEYPMQSDIIKDKAKETFIDKYGVDNPMKSEMVKDIVRETNLERYGGHYMTTDFGRNHVKDVLMSKYGVDNIMKLEYYKDIIKLTNLKKYNCEYPIQNDDVMYKSKKTCIDKYGVDNPMKSEMVKDIVRQTNLERYGVEYFINSTIFKENTKISMLEKYGSEYPTISENLRVKNYDMCKNIDYRYYLGDSVSVFRCVEGHDYEIKNDNYHTRTKSGLPLCTICNPIGDSQSIKEKILYEFIISIYNGVVIQSYRDGLEIDIYLPELNIGFEFNGLYWHSEKYKDKNYHLGKTKYFHERGIRIIHIWEDDLVNKREILKSQISNLVGSTTHRIFARNCKVKYVDNSTKFLNDNHIQGVDRSVVKIGLFYNEELVSVMTFNKLEGRVKMLDGEWNLSRFCNRVNTSVIGGASKLLKNFIKDNNATRIISYADRDWSVGNLYEVLGFTLVGESGPDYKYVVDGLRRHKQNYKKSNLGIQGDKVTEKQHMASLGYYRIWDCGKIKYEFYL